MLQQVGCFIGGVIFGVTLCALILIARTSRATTTQRTPTTFGVSPSEAIPYSPSSAPRPTGSQRFDDRYFSMEP